MATVAQTETTGKNLAVLERLKQGPADSRELTELVGSRYSGQLAELRLTFGYDIRTERRQGFPSRFVLLPGRLPKDHRTGKYISAAGQPCDKPAETRPLIGPWLYQQPRPFWPNANLFRHSCEFAIRTPKGDTYVYRIDGDRLDGQRAGESFQYTAGIDASSLRLVDAGRSDVMLVLAQVLSFVARDHLHVMTDAGWQFLHAGPCLGCGEEMATGAERHVGLCFGCGAI